jgi:hypothetical protein
MGDGNVLRSNAPVTRWVSHWFDQVILLVPKEPIATADGEPSPAVEAEVIAEISGTESDTPRRAGGLMGWAAPKGGRWLYLGVALFSIKA